MKRLLLIPILLLFLCSTLWAADESDRYRILRGIPFDQIVKLESVCRDGTIQGSAFAYDVNGVGHNWPIQVPCNGTDIVVYTKPKPVQLARMNPYVLGAVASAVACATPTIYDFNEGFQTATTGYENAPGIWTASANAPNPAADTTALTSGKPAGACNQALLSDDAGGEYRYIQANPNLGAVTRYYRFWIYIETRPGGTDATYIMSVSEATASLHLGGVYLRGTNIWLATGESLGNLVDAGEITEDAWHQIDLKLVTNGAIGTCSLQVDGGTLYTNAVAAPNDYQNYIQLGTHKLTENGWHVYIDRFHYDADTF